MILYNCANDLVIAIALNVDLPTPMRGRCRRRSLTRPGLAGLPFALDVG